MTRRKRLQQDRSREEKRVMRGPRLSYNIRKHVLAFGNVYKHRKLGILVSVEIDAAPITALLYVLAPPNTLKTKMRYTHIFIQDLFVHDVLCLVPYESRFGSLEPRDFL